MSMWWILILVIVAFLTWLIYLGGKPGVNELSAPHALAKALSHLFRYGTQGATLSVFSKIEPEKRVIVTKHILALDNVALVVSIAFKDATDAARFRDDLARRGVQEPVQAGVNAVRFDVGRDVGLAHVVTTVALRDVFGLSIERDCTGEFRNVIARNVPKLTGLSE